jgi:putative aldouronate transport system substrate-binding protein
MIETWYGAGNRWTERDGKLVPSFETEEFLEANRFIKKMVDEKLINPDFATFDGTKWNEPFFNGKGGMIVDVDSRVSVLINLFKQANPNDFENKVGFVGSLKGPMVSCTPIPLTATPASWPFPSQASRPRLT